MINTLGILFYIRTDKSRKTGEVPIYLRITVNGHRAETSIKRKIDPTRWDSNKGRVKGTREDVREMNQYMDLIRAKVQKIHAEFLEKGQVPTAQGLKDKLLGNPSQVHYLIPLFE